jgi:hypothetical protein
MIVAFLALLAAPGAPTQDGLPRLARFELEGPLERAVLASGDIETTLLAALAAGETLVVEIPFPARAFEPPRLVEPPGAAAARVRFAGWSEPVEPGPLARLPRGLTARPAPIETGAHPHPSAVGGTIVLAAAMLALALRRRPRAAFAAALAAVLALGVLPVVAGTERAEVRVLEGDAASGRWALVEASRDEVSFPARDLLRLAVVPPGDVHWTVDLGPPGGGGTTWTARAPGRRLVRTAAFEPAGALTSDANGLGDFDGVWLRASGRGFEWRGPWRRGEALPPPGAPGVPSPPGWLVGGLPPGTPVLVGRLRGDGPFVRVVGFSWERN